MLIHFHEPSTTYKNGDLIAAVDWPAVPGLDHAVTVQQKDGSGYHGWVRHIAWGELRKGGSVIRGECFVSITLHPIELEKG